MTPRLFFALVITACVLVFIVQNTAVVEIRFLFWRLSMSRSLFLLVMLASGFGLGWLAHGLSARRRGR